MKIGVIGLGAMGINHARIYNELGMLGGVVELDSDRLADAKDRFKVEGSKNPDWLRGRVDAVSIAAPTENHIELAKRCISMGMDVLVEKPISDDVNAAEELLEHAKKHKKIVAVGYIERFNPAFRALKSFLLDGGVGAITSINIKRVGGWPRTATNVILDLMTHDFDLLTCLMDNQTPEAIHTNKRVNSSRVVDSAQVLLKYGNVSATCESNWISPIKRRVIEVTGTQGYCEADLIKQELTNYNTDVVKNNPDLVFKDYQSFQQFVSNNGEPSCVNTVRFRHEPLKEELKAFVSALYTRDTSQLVTGKQAVKALKMTLQAAGIV